MRTTPMMAHRLSLRRPTKFSVLRNPACMAAALLSMSRHPSGESYTPAWIRRTSIAKTLQPSPVPARLQGHPRNILPAAGLHWI